MTRTAIPAWIMHAIRAARTAALAIAVAVAASSGCRRSRPDARATEPTLPLVVHNYGFFDVTIYALLSTTGEARMRLGLVGGSSSTTIAVPRRGRLPDGALVLMLHAVGARGSWVSPTVVVPDDGIACLDIYSDATGDLSRSVLYASITSARQSENHAASGRRVVASTSDDCAPPESPNTGMTWLRRVKNRAMSPIA